MTPYANHSGDSGVRAYAIAATAIEVQFADGTVYVYNYTIPGRAKVEAMKRLARSGRGLSTYISQQVRGAYADKRDA